MVKILPMNFLPEWDFHFLDLSGCSGGYALGINKRNLNLYKGGEGFLGADITSSELNMPFRLINIYGPCHNTERFWNSLMDAEFMQDNNLVIGGDLYFSLGLAKSWGCRAQCDHLLAFFKNLLDSHELLSINSAKILLTWRNRRISVGMLPRKLDHFLIKALLLTSLNLFR